MKVASLRDRIAAVQEAHSEAVTKLGQARAKAEAAERQRHAALLEGDADGARQAGEAAGSHAAAVAAAEGEVAAIERALRELEATRQREDWQARLEQAREELEQARLQAEDLAADALATAGHLAGLIRGGLAAETRCQQAFSSVQDLERTLRGEPAPRYPHGSSPRPMTRAIDNDVTGVLRALSRWPVEGKARRP